ncbi:MAG: ATP-dependent zinc metalloprotease FtsH [Planctomycetota bacterium]
MADETPKPQENKPSGGEPSGGPRRQLAPAGWVVGLMLALLALLLIQQVSQSEKEISFSTFYSQALEGNVRAVRVQGTRLQGEFVEAPLLSSLKKPKEEGPSETTGDLDTPPSSETVEPDAESPADTGSPADTESDSVAEADKKDSDEARLPKRFYVIVPGGFDGELRATLIENGVIVEGEEPFDWGGLLTLVWFGFMIVMIVLLFSFFRRARDQMMGGGMLGGVTKSPARRYDAEDGPRKTFDDVAGLKSVKTDLKEIVEFLREPERFHQLGARVPKGVLLSGPPGTGKTLLAKAVAGEAGVPFYSINGSEFIQLFVGVGASRVRDMFKTAKKNAPAILFIDEIDAVGRQRGAGLGGGHDEREQTLNQILSEMDGFSQEETVIVIAATNRPDVLDPALLRPGRFDRHVTVDRPSLDGRKQLFEVHTREIPLSEDVDFERLARGTVGLTGADIQNLCNEAALWATRQGDSVVGMDDFEYAHDKVLMGAARDDVMTDREKKVTAYHEAGHALVGWRMPSGDRVHKVSIIPRGRALGVTQFAPEEDRHNASEPQLRARLAMALAGRAAESLVFDEVSVGAENDLKRSTEIARKMVTHWGMSERLGPVALHNSQDDPFLGREIVQEHRPYSEHTAQIVDDEVSKILHQAADDARRTLTEGRADLEALAEALLDREEIDEDEITELIGPASVLAGAAASEAPMPAPATRDNNPE